MKPFLAICSGLGVYCSYFDQTITEISGIVKKITYLWHTRVAAAISNKSNEQHMHKLGIAHSCYERLHTRPVFSWVGYF